MIIVRLVGGLGNSMFEYALGRRLSIQNSDELRFDISSYKTNKIADCSYWLESFDIDIRGKTIGPAGRLVHEMTHMRRIQTIKARFFEFDPTILTLRGDIMLHGWWQSEKYFREIRETLLKDFTPCEALSAENIAAKSRMSSQNSIAVHIRRADYVANPKTRRIHGELPQRYFLEAIEYIKEKTGTPVLYIFSDDLAWVKNNWTFPYETIYVDWNPDDPIGWKAMIMQSYGKHNIIANSSFGWWGAWLNQNPDKIVVTPEKWFRDYPAHNTRDLVPESWVRIPSYFAD